MLLPDLKEEEVLRLKNRMKFLYKKIIATEPRDAASTFREFEKVFSMIWRMTEGFQYSAEGIESDVEMGLSSKKREEGDTYFRRSINKMEHDLRSVFSRIFEEDDISEDA